MSYRSAMLCLPGCHGDRENENISRLHSLGTVCYLETHCEIQLSLWSCWEVACVIKGSEGFPMTSGFIPKVSLLFMFSSQVSISLPTSPQLDAARESSQDTGTILSDFLVSRTMWNKAHFLQYKLLSSKYFLIATENGLRDKAEDLLNHFHTHTY